MSISDNLWVYDDAVRVLDTMLVYNVFAQFSIPPGSVTCASKEALAGTIPALPGPIARTYGALVCAGIERLGLDPAAFTVECWNNRTFESGTEVDYHVDNDEVLRQATGRLSVPAYGLIFHVGPDGEGVGGTWFDPPSRALGADPRLFTRPNYADIVSPAGRLVSFRPGRLVLFDGLCPHCVEPFARIASPRVAILVNFWPNERGPAPRPLVAGE